MQDQDTASIYQLVLDKLQYLDHKTYLQVRSRGGLRSEAVRLLRLCSK